MTDHDAFSHRGHMRAHTYALPKHVRHGASCGMAAIAGPPAELSSPAGCRARRIGQNGKARRLAFLAAGSTASRFVRSFALSAHRHGERKHGGGRIKTRVDSDLETGTAYRRRACPISARYRVRLRRKRTRLGV
jgi:hypothetical protein